MKYPKKSADRKTILHSEKGKQGGTAETMRRHVMRHHPELVDGPETGMSSIMSLYMEEAGERQSVQAHDQSVQVRKDALDAAIEQYRKIPCIDENSDPLLFGKGHDIPGSALEPLLPLAASISAVPATEAICELRGFSSQEDRDRC